MESLWRAVPDLTWELVGNPFVSLDRTRLVATWRLVGPFTGPMDSPGWVPTNDRIEVMGVEVLEFEGDQVRRESSYLDMATITRQIGALPARGSTAERIGALLQHWEARRRRARARSGSAAGICK